MRLAICFIAPLLFAICTSMYAGASSGMWPVPNNAQVVSGGDAEYTMFWDCESATSAVDASDNQITMTVTGTSATFVSSGGESEGYLDLKGTGSGYHSGAGFSFTSGTKLNRDTGTITLYFKPVTVNSLLVTVYSGSTIALQIFGDPSATPRVYIQKEGTKLANVSVNPTGNIWNKVVVSWDMTGGAGAGVISGSVNDTPFTSFTGLDPFANEFDKFYAGENNTNTWTGVVDTITLYSTVQ